MSTTTTTGFYVFLHPEKATVLGLLRLLFVDSDLSDKECVETNMVPAPRPSFIERLFMVGTLLTMKAFLSMAGLLGRFMSAIEHGLNFLCINGGLLHLIWRIISGRSCASPEPESAAYRSITHCINNTGEVKAPECMSCVSLDGHEIGIKDKLMVELAANASALAYENAAAIQDVVNNQWQMSFVEFFDCWDSTEAFVFCDKETDAGLIVLAFRGTQQGQDLITDLDFSWIHTSVMGSVHVGFMRALGPVPDRTKSFVTWFPTDYTGNEKLAYYTIRTALITQARKHKNAKIMITGHSLGGALAVLFTSLLAYHGHTDILDRVQYVKTFGQPRVGDEAFAEYMNDVLDDKYTRSVYRFDLVPRIPFDLPVLMKFKHFGTCIQYDGWFKGEMVEGMRNKNYFNPLFLPWIYLVYLWDFILIIWWGLRRCEWEGLTAIIYRILCILLPGLIFHNGSNYTRSAAQAKVSSKRIRASH